MKRLIIKKELYEQIKEDEKFLDATLLSKILSAIQYNNNIYGLLSEYAKKEFDTYLKLYLVINHASFLYRGIKKFNTIRRNRPEIENLDSFKSNKEIINKYFDESNPFFKTILSIISGRVGFHFDKLALKEKLQEFVNKSGSEEIVFIESKNDLNIDMKFSLANNLDFHYILGLVKGESDEERFKTLALELNSLSKIFCDTLQEIIPELIEDYCELKEE